MKLIFSILFLLICTAVYCSIQTGPNGTQSSSATLPTVVGSVTITNGSASTVSEAIIIPGTNGLYRLTGYGEITTGSAGCTMIVTAGFTDDRGVQSYQMENIAGDSQQSFTLPDYNNMVFTNKTTIYPTFQNTAGAGITFFVTFNAGAGSSGRYKLYLVLEQLK